ncbi:MAG: hypothetical protein KME45_33570 [Stenomitos rutilans HA7619-LM2]|jgi:hypothetical protein|nr:hypothetical protein [Stenomitos rutilans HA7619-LM2]
MSSLTNPLGQMGLPLLSETLAFLRDLDLAKRRHRQYGPIVKTQLLGNPTVFLKGVEANDFVPLTKISVLSAVGRPA